MAYLVYTTLLGTLTSLDQKTMTYLDVCSGDTTQSPQNLGFAHQMSPALVSPDSALELGMDTFPGSAFAEGKI